MNKTKAITLAIPTSILLGAFFISSIAFAESNEVNVKGNIDVPSARMGIETNHRMGMMGGAPMNNDNRDDDRGEIEDGDHGRGMMDGPGHPRGRENEDEKDDRDGMPSRHFIGMGFGSTTAGVFGSVTSVNGSSFEMTTHGPRNATTTASTTYTVDTTNASVIKNGATTTVASILVGDTVMVEGGVGTSTIVSTVVRDGMGGRGMMGTRPHDKGQDDDKDNDKSDDNKRDDNGQQEQRWFERDGFLGSIGGFFHRHFWFF